MWSKIGGWIVAALGINIGALIAKALVAMGIGYGTYNFVMPSFKGMIQGQFGGMPADVVSVMAAAKVDVAITILLSAVTVRMATRVFWKKVG